MREHKEYERTEGEINKHPPPSLLNLRQATPEDELATANDGGQPRADTEATAEAAPEHNAKVKVTHQRAGPKSSKPKPSGLNTTSSPISIPTPKSNSRSNHDHELRRFFLWW